MYGSEEVYCLSTRPKPLIRRLFLALLILFLLLLGAVIVSAALGPVSIPWDHTAAILLKRIGITTSIPFTERELLMVDQIRLPRILVGGLVGAALGVSGVVMQALFRNPLAEPGVVGVSSGAALGAVGAIYFGWAGVSRWFMPAAAFAGAMLAVIVVFLVWTRSRRSGAGTLLLVGIGINSFLSAVISLMVANAPNENELRGIIYWLQGGLEARTWEHVYLVAWPILLGCLLLMAFARDLNMLLLGDDHARTSGIDVARTRGILLAIASVVTGAAVAVSGIIGFVGLVIPHSIRLVAGPDHRLLLPASALGGAGFLIIADTISRLAWNPVTIQVGVVTSLIGAPFFLYLVLRGDRKGATP